MNINRVKILGGIFSLGVWALAGCHDASYAHQLESVQVPAPNQDGGIQVHLQGAIDRFASLHLEILGPDESSLMSELLAVEPGLGRVVAALSLPEGIGYSAKLSALTSTKLRCEATGFFNVVAGQTTPVPLIMRCRPQGPEDNHGDVNIEVDVGPALECPQVSLISAIPAAAPVGTQIKLSATALGPPGDFQWSTTGTGRLIDASQANAIFECTQAGPAMLNLEVSAGAACKTQYPVQVECLPNPDAEVEGASQPVRIEFRPRVGAEPFACGRSYAGLGTTSASAQPSDFRFFVHNLRLLTSDGQEHPVKIEDRGQDQWADVALIDFEGGPGKGCFGGSDQQNLVITGTAPKKAYTGIRFTVGVPGALNHADPTSLQGPLLAGGMAWNWRAGFKFLKFELGAGVLHVGSTACSGTPPDGVKCRRPNRPEIELSDFDPASDAVYVDLAAAFAGVDLSANPSCHGTGSECEPLFETLGLDFESGSAGQAQRVFSIGPRSEP